MPTSGAETSIEPRPWWMTALAVAFGVSLPFHVLRDLLVAGNRDVEVWLGLEVTGPAALATAPLHWAILGLFAWAFWKQRPWALVAAAGYAFYVAASHLVWSEASPRGRGWPIGLLQAAAISAFGALLLHARGRGAPAPSDDVARSP